MSIDFGDMVMADNMLDDHYPADILRRVSVSLTVSESGEHEK